MKPRVIGAFIIIALALVACMSERKSAQMNKSIAEVLIAPFNTLAVQLTGGQDIGYATAAFQRKNSRWPTNQTELTNFVAKSDGYLALRDYDRIDFANQPEGSVRITFVPHGKTNERSFTMSTNLQTQASILTNTNRNTGKPETIMLSDLLGGVTGGNGIPEKFSTYIGGFMGSRYTVELRRGILVYSSQDPGKKTATVKIKPSSRDWRNFRQALDAIPVWNWQTNYQNKDVYDGTQWRVEISYKDRSISATGSNSYPKENGKPNVEPHPTPSFKDYCAAVVTLIGGRKFE